MLYYYYYPTQSVVSPLIARSQNTIVEKRNRGKDCIWFSVESVLFARLIRPATWTQSTCGAAKGILDNNDVFWNNFNFMKAKYKNPHNAQTYITWDILI